MPKRYHKKYMLLENKKCIIAGASGGKKTNIISRKNTPHKESQWERNESQISLYIKTAGRLQIVRVQSFLGYSKTHVYVF
jgi:hypothetical protein